MTSEKLPQAFHSLFFSPLFSLSWSFSRMDRGSAGTSMLSGDKVLFFTKPPSVAQARPIRRQWLVNSRQSGGKPRRDRGSGAILLMNYLSGQNNNVLPLSSPFLASPSLLVFFSLPWYFCLAILLFYVCIFDETREEISSCCKFSFRRDHVCVNFHFRPDQAYAERTSNL